MSERCSTVPGEAGQRAVEAVSVVGTASSRGLIECRQGRSLSRARIVNLLRSPGIDSWAPETFTNPSSGELESEHQRQARGWTASSKGWPANYKKCNFTKKIRFKDKIIIRSEAKADWHVMKNMKLKLIYVTRHLLTLIC
jgi:hypothetical protein